MVAMFPVLVVFWVTHWLIHLFHIPSKGSLRDKSPQYVDLCCDRSTFIFILFVLSFILND